MIPAVRTGGILLVLAVLIGCAGSPEPNSVPTSAAPETALEAPGAEDAGADGGPAQADGPASTAAESPVTPPATGEPAPVPAKIEDEPPESPPAAPGKTPSTERKAPLTKARPELPETSTDASEPDGPDAAAVVPVPDRPAIPGIRTDGEEDGESPSVAAIPPVNPLLTEDRPLSPSRRPGEQDVSPPDRPASPAGEQATAGEPATVPAETPAPRDGDASGTETQDSEPGAGESTAASQREFPPSSPEPPATDGDTESVYPALAAENPGRFLDEPGEFTVTLDGVGWVFRSDLSTPGSWNFLERERDGDSTRFRFRFDRTGDWNLVFERQDPSAGGSEREVRRVRVGDDGAASGEDALRAAAAATADRPADPDERHQAALEALEEGRFGEAFSYWEEDAGLEGPDGLRARESIVEHAARSSSAAPLLAWLPAYMDDDPDPGILELALAAFENLAGYPDQSTAILEVLLEDADRDRRPEWMFQLARRLEEPGPNRDLDRSAGLYAEIVEDWPLSEWREPAQERLDWLQRHYFRIR